MEIAIAIVVIAAIVLAWRHLRRRKSNRDQPAPVVVAAAWDEDTSESDEDTYAVLRVNKSRSSDREYRLLQNETTGEIACTCPGYRYSPEDGCIHTTEYIAGMKVDEYGAPLRVEGRPLRFRDTDSTNQEVGKGRALQPSRGAELDPEEWKYMDYVVLDTETTGLSGRSKVVEIAIVDRDGQVLINTLVNPGRTPIQAAAREVHGITRDDVKGKPTFDELWPGIKRIFDDHEVVLTYNADFDFRLMAQSLTQSGYQEEIEAIRRGCIMKGYFQWQVDNHQRKINEPYATLEAAARSCEARVEGTPHRALYDCEAARQVATYMLAENG